MSRVSPSSWTFFNSGLSIGSCEPQLTPSSCESGSWAAVYRYQNMCLCNIYNMLHAVVLSFRCIDSLVLGPAVPTAEPPTSTREIFDLINLIDFYLQKVDWLIWTLVHGQSSWLMSHESWAVTVNAHDFGSHATRSRPTLFSSLIGPSPTWNTGGSRTWWTSYFSVSSPSFEQLYHGQDICDRFWSIFHEVEVEGSGFCMRNGSILWVRWDGPQSYVIPYSM